MTLLPLRRTICVLWLLLLLPLATRAQIPIPDPPKDNAFVSDFGGLLHEPELRRIAAAQERAFNTHGVPIIVVTIASMKVYGHNGTIEDFAATWFNKWRIGTMDDPKGGNTGVLLLVSVGDRRARIELGADWGHDWNAHCQRIMDDEIIPHFKRGDYSGGIAKGVESLAAMAEKGPQSTPAKPGVMLDVKRAATSEQPLTQSSPIPGRIAVGMVGFGILLIVGALFAPEGMRKPLLIVGIVMVVLPFCFWMILLGVAIYSGVTGKGRTSGGGGGGISFGGGGFSGGSAGGGGASGSW